MGFCGETSGSVPYYSLWDEDNRISEIDDNGERSNYTYDDKGERVIKLSRQGETVYVNQYYVVRNRSIVSKHLFAGTSRLVTKLVMGTAPGNSYKGAGTNGAGGQGSTPANAGQDHSNQGNAYGHDKDNQGLHLGQDKQNPGQGDANGNNNNSLSRNAGEGGGGGKANGHAAGKGGNANDAADSGTEGATNLPGNSDKGLENALANGKGNKYGIYKRLDKLGDSVDASGEIVVDSDAGTGTGSVTTPPASGQSEFTYYYHPDHLGSTGYVTDANGKLYEHLEYFPFGETWVQEHSNTLRTPYLFTGKEFDQETGLYYFGARYYDPRTSVWVSADRILGRYLNGEPNGGAFAPVHLALYSYVTNNPLIYTDPDGDAEAYSTSGQFIGSFAPKLDKVFVWPDGGGTKLTDTHMTMGQFHTVAATVKGEAGSKTNQAEMSGIAHVIKNKGAKSHMSMYESATFHKGKAYSFYGSKSASAMGFMKNPQASGKRNDAARAGVIDAIINPTDPVGGRTMFEGSSMLGPKETRQPGSNFQEKFVDTGVAHDPQAVGGTTFFQERSAGEAAKWKAAQPKD